MLPTLLHAGYADKESVLHATVYMCRLPGAHEMEIMRPSELSFDTVNPAEPPDCA